MSEAYQEICRFVSAVAGTIDAREAALLVWLGLFILWCSIKKGLNSCTKRLIKCAMNPKLVVIYAAIFIYSGALLIVLDSFGLFTVYQVKYFVIWVFSVAFLPLWKMKMFEEDLIRSSFSMIKSQITIFALFSIFISLSPFDFWIEFLIGVPIIFLVSFSLAIAESDNNIYAAKIISKLSLIIIFVVALKTSYNIYLDVDAYINKELVTNFIFLIMLTFLYIPFAIALTMLFAYESLFTRFDIVSKDRGVAVYSKIAMLFSFNFNVVLAKRWMWLAIRNKYKTISDVNSSIASMLKIWWEEKFPRPVCASEGWPSEEARRYLERYGFKIGYYEWITDDYFSSISSYADRRAINIYQYDFFALGTRGVVKKFVLKLFAVDIIEEEGEGDSLNNAFREFILMSGALWEKALDEEMPVQFIDSIISLTDIEMSRDGIAVNFKFSSNENKYEMRFEIKRNDWTEPI